MVAGNFIVGARYLAVDPSAEGAVLGETKRRVCVVSLSIEI
jgi:hypothetical protein